jgi:hypothetical protein
MGLSERESRMLQEMETHLLAEDPRLASTMGARRLPIGVGAVLTVSGVALGILLMVVGVGRGHALGITLALVGYVVLLLSVTVVGEWLSNHGNAHPFARRTPNRARRAS